MELPNADEAYVDPGKVRDYLLPGEHLVGQHKARTFGRLGFERRDWHVLQRELLRIAREGTVVDRILTIYGIKYVVDDRINGPAGSVVVRTVWLVERGQAVPRLVTAYHIGGVDEGT